jgi:hypothetical protein
MVGRTRRSYVFGVVADDRPDSKAEEMTGAVVLDLTLWLRKHCGNVNWQLRLLRLAATLATYGTDDANETDDPDEADAATGAVVARWLG